MRQGWHDRLHILIGYFPLRILSLEEFFETFIMSSPLLSFQLLLCHASMQLTLRLISGRKVPMNPQQSDYPGIFLKQSY
jgi:hypothetical protein